jgi:hypothetical protein
MKLLFEESNRNEVDRIRLLLESAGIPVFIGNEVTARNFNFIALAQKYGIWVMEDSQYECAVSLISNPDYCVKNPLDVNEYHKLAESTEQIDAHSFIWQKIVTPIVLFVIGFIAFMLVLKLLIRQ